MTEVAKTETNALPRFRQPTDIIEKEDGYHIVMDMPGVAKENIDIDLQDNELVVTGKTGYDLREGEKYLEAEFGNCEYRRAFTLADTVDREKIKAVMANGVLELSLPKAEKALPKRIEIKAG